MKRDDLLRKIRGLLAIGNRSNYEAEAQTAMAAAQRLMLEHGLTLDDIGEASQYEKQGFGDSFARRPPEDIYVTDVLERFFFVRCGWTQKHDVLSDSWRMTRRIFGQEHHRAVAQFVWVYLARTYRALWNARKRELRRCSGRQSIYYEGLTTGIIARLQAERHEQFSGRHGLIVATNAALDRACAIAIPNAKVVGGGSVRKIDDHDLQALIDGSHRGRKLAIPTAIAGKASAPKLLEAAR